MAEVQPVPLGRPPARSWLPTVAWSALIALAVVLVKPWGGPAPAPPESTTSPREGAPTGLAAGATHRTEPFDYDPRLFGGREPDPAWELWPAGYVVQFGFSGPLPVHGQTGPDPNSSPSAPTASATGSPGPSLHPPPGGTNATPAASGPPGTPADPVVDLGPTNHLIALGINTPLDVQVAEVALWFADDGGVCCARRLDIVSLPTLWESPHFIAIGVADPADPLRPGPWPVGEYRLDLLTVASELRSVRLRVTAPLH